MKRNFYIGEGKEAKAAIDAGWAKVQVFRDAGNALLNGMPEGTKLCSRDSGRGIIIGFGIQQELSADERARLGLSPDVPRPDSDGKHIPTYKPNSRSNNGKELRKRINAVNRLHTTFSKEVIAALGIDRWCHDGSKVFMSSAGCTDTALLVSIPGSPDDGQSDKFPDIPDFLREVKESEFLAAQGR
jgi:hypothetical protein